MHHTYKKNVCSRFGNSTIARACAEIVVKAQICIDFEIISRLHSKHLDEQLCPWKLLIGTTMQPNNGKGVKRGDSFLIVGKPIAIS